MALVDDEVHLDVSVYLLKKTKVLEAQRQLAAAIASTYPLIEAIPGGAFLALPSEAAPPRWLKPISALLAPGEQPELAGQAPGAILWVPREDKTFVFSFGYGHTKIKDEWVEPDFGKNVTLAVVPQGQVREVRAEQVFAKRHIASERAPRASAVREFNFEANRDLVTAVEGVPEAEYWSTFGMKVRGGASFKFELNVAKLNETIDKLIERYDSGDHRLRWPQANNLIPIRDDEKIKKLDALLNDLLAKKQPEKFISLAAPTERSGDSSHPQHFIIGRKRKDGATSPYLMLASWEKLLPNDQKLSAEAARKTLVHLLDESKEEIGICSMYQCIGAEVDLDHVTHVLSSGHWYAADRDFIKSTNDALATLKPPPVLLEAWNRIDNEGPYNEAAAKANPDLWLFDKELIHYGGGNSSFEYCDILHLPRKTLYFVKHPSGSAGVSHLCEQVRRTAELFFDPDAGYRMQLTEKIKKSKKHWSTEWLGTRPQMHEWNLCLVLMGKELSALPFFAKCGVARLLGELHRLGLNVSFQAV